MTTTTTDRTANRDRLKAAAIAPVWEADLPYYEGKASYARLAWQAINKYTEAGQARRQDRLYNRLEAAGLGKPPKGCW